MAKILVCDDDKEIVEAIEIYLTQDGHQVLEAYDGIEAVEILKKESVDLLIMDIMMPIKTGIEALRENSREAQYSDHYSVCEIRGCRQDIGT